MQVKNKLLKYDGYIFLYATFVSLYIVYSLFNVVSFELINLNELYIGEATKEGVDVGLRASIIYRAILFFIPTFAISYFIYSKYLGYKQNRTLCFISTVGILQILLSALDVKMDTTINLFFWIFVFISLIYLLPLSKKITDKVINRKLSSLSVVLAYIVVYNFQFLLAKHTWLNQETPYVYLLVFVLFSLLPVIIKESLLKKIIPYFTLLALSPVFIVLSIEIDISTHISLGYKQVYLLLFLIAFVSLIIAKRIFHFNLPNVDNAGKYFLIPGTLILFTLSTSYFPYLEPYKEFFELANPSNSLANIFLFQEIPFLDYFSSHMFSEQWYGILYTLIHGYTGDLSYFTYSFLNNIIGVLVVYYFLNRTFNKAIYSLAFILTFPFLGSLFYIHVFLGFIAIFQIIKISKDTSVKNYLSLLFLCTALILWRLDTGVATLFSVLIFTPIYFYLRGVKVEVKKLLFALSIFAGSIVICLLIAFILRSPEYVINNFKSALHYAKASQAHGYSVIKRIDAHQYYIYHIIFPVLSILAILYSVFKLNKEKNKFLLFSLFAFIMYLANIQRGLVRHGFAEGNELYLMSTFFLAFALFVVGISKKRNLKELGFYITAFAIILFAKYFNYHPSMSSLEKSLTESAFYNFDTAINNNGDARMIGQKEFAKEHYSDLSKFLKENFTDDQSFVDFSNTPMLYYYTGRKSPGYFNQNLQNTIDDFTQLQLIQQINTETHPVVLYSNYPNSWFDKTDGVENSVRYYLLSEYIHSNYKPHGIINNKSVWIAKDLDLPRRGLEQDSIYKSQKTFNYKLLAGYIAKYYAVENPSYLNNIQEDFYKGTQQLYDLKLPTSIKNTPSLYLKLNIGDFTNNQEIKVNLKNKADENLASFTFKLNTKLGEAYMLRISNHYIWHTGEVESLELESQNNFSLRKSTFIKDTRIENKTAITN